MAEIVVVSIISQILKFVKRNAWTKEDVELLEKAANPHLVAATLITTMTFAAGITMPGGFVDKDGTHPGSAILRSSAAFVAFVIFDIISLVFSSTAVLIHLLVPLLPRPESRASFSTVAGCLFWWR
ncbi:hypothetical protein CJ030_MR0G002911 [Morella rubra]|uniref:PGG domain-containing protein n=1 Tax=Morella rubra TaxID=262757 RepID=A0A6A1UM82_9ROSI|nr:hypothetical protein CJ030_MR0G002911 [Morella rubra]